MASSDPDIYEITFQAFGSKQNNVHTVQLPINNDKYYYHIVTGNINNSHLTARLYDDKNNELQGLQFKNGELSQTNSIKIIVDTTNDFFQLNVTVWGYAKQLLEPKIEAQSFHRVRIKPSINYHPKVVFNMRYRLQGSEDWIDAMDKPDLKVNFQDEVYEAQLSHDIPSLGITIYSPIIIIKEHWKQLSESLRINMEDLAVHNTFTATFGERFFGDGAASATIESVDNNNTLIELDSLASTVFYSKTQLRSGERYLFKFQATSLSRPSSKEYASIDHMFTVPSVTDDLLAQREEWTSKFGKEVLKFSSEGKTSRWDRSPTEMIYRLQLHPSGWFILEIEGGMKANLRLAGTFRCIKSRSDSVLLYPLIRNKYTQRQPFVIEGDESGAHSALLIAEIVHEIMRHVSAMKNDCRLVCKYWYQSLPLSITADIGTACNLKYLSQSKLLQKI